MKIVSKKVTALAVALSAASIATVGLFALAAPFAPDSVKPTPPPGHSFDEAKAIVAASRLLHEQYLRDFVASGRDPRSLPRGMMEATGDVPAALADAVRGAQLVARASVVRTTFTSGPDGFPVATSTLRLTDVLKAPAAQAAGVEVQILQVGGPIPQPKPIDGVLAQLTTDELVLTGDDVIILANYRTDLGVFQGLPGAGIYFVRNSRVVPEDSNRFGATLLGASPANVLTLMRQFIP